MKNLYTLLLFSLICLSCSSDSAKIDSSAITSYKWQLSALKTSVPIDLNRDGTASTDMTLELDCMKSETFFFTQNDFYYTTDGVTITTNADHSIREYHCNEEFPYGFGIYGISKMLDESTIELYFKEIESGIVGTFHPFKLNYKLVGDKLIRTGEESYPTTYNETTTSWVNTVITVTREYSKVP